jgi:cytoskeletal protein CcmA (bactofilin family)
MPCRSKALVALLIGGGFLLALTTPALAAETSNSEFVIIREDDVFPDDLYAGAIRVLVEGTLEGDLVAFAAEEIIINGTVTGSVFASTPRLTLNGDIGGSLRVTANRLDIAGEVDGDVVGAVVTARLAPESEVMGEVLLWAWNGDVLGTIGADLTGTQRNLELAGEVGGDVEVSISRLEVVDDLVVGGDLGYRSESDAVGLERATVAGALVPESPLPPNLRVRALGLLGRFLVVIFLSIAALSVVYLWPRRSSQAIAGVGQSPVRKWLRGASILFSPLIGMALTGVILGLAPAAAALPLLAVFVPVILALVGLAFALSLVAGAPIAGWLGGVLFKRLDLYGAILAGSLLIGVVWYAPILGWVVPLIVLPWGLGSWMTAWGQSAEAELPSMSEETSAPA